MIIGAHSILYSRKPEADRALLRDVLRLPDVALPGGGKLGVYQPRHARPKAARRTRPPTARTHSRRRAT